MDRLRSGDRLLGGELIETAAAPAVAGRVAAEHLRALGCAVFAHATAGTAAAHLTVDAPVGVGAPVRVDCAIDWAGPVEVPLHDEPLIQAACGIMHVHGRRSARPRALHLDYASTSAGVLAASGVLAAVIGQARGIDQSSADTSVAQAGLLLVSQYLAAATAADDEWAEAFLAGGPPFESADGVRFEIETLKGEGWARFWTLLDADQPALRRGWRVFEQRFATATCPLAEDLHTATRRVRFDELVGLAATAGISILSLRDERAGRVARADAGTAGRPPWQMTELPASEAPRPPLKRTTGTLPLEGLVVIEATRRLQGPMAGHLLSLLGARVTHVESPGGDPLRGAPPMAGDTSARFLALNRLKHRVDVDISTAAGCRAVRELVAGADVFLHNWAPGKAAQLGLDASDLEAVRPGLVYAYASAWGARLGAGPGLGTDYMVQAFSGLAAALRPGKPAAVSLMTLTDLLGGLICAEGVLGGLLEQVRTGIGQRVDSSLLSAATALLEHERAGSAAAPLREPLATADGYLALSARAGARPRRVAAALGLVLDDRQPVRHSIAAGVADERTLTSVERLSEAGLGAVEVCTDLSRLAVDPRFAGALERGDCALPRPPWTFAR